LNEFATKKWAIWLICDWSVSNVHFISVEVGNDAQPILVTLITTSIILIITILFVPHTHVQL
jgi:hypothetical protein